METTVSKPNQTANRMDAPLVSIIIPAYNYAQFIAAAIK
jgi:hypothetical protein